MLKELYDFTPQLILRTPAQPFTLAIDESAIWAALHEGEFMEAIYLASPVLYEECEKWRRGELTNARKLTRLQRTLARYYARRSSRSTPFGLFAGCSLIEWGTTSRIRLAPNNSGRHTRLDMHYLCALGQQLAGTDDVRARLRYYPNTSLYRRGKELRYVEHQYNGGECLHQLSAIEASAPVLHAVVAAAQGPTGYELVEGLLDDECEREDATAFVQELLRAQVLVSELAPTVTGPEYFFHLQAVLTRLLGNEPNSPGRAVTQRLAAVGQQLQDLDQRRVNTATDYERIVATLTPLGVPIEPGKLFQTDATHGLAGAATLDVALQATLLEAVEVLTYLAPLSQNSRLEEFIRRFEARYEGREVPLLEALDTESGLAYATEGVSRYSALVHDLVLPERALPTALPPIHPDTEQLLRRKLSEAERSRGYNVTLTLAELQAQRGPAAGHPLAPSIGILFRPLDATRVIVESASGSSAVNLLGRFAHAEPNIDALIQRVTQREQACNPEVAFAEVCHLPVNRIGNLLQRPHFRALEIPYLAQSALPASGQVRVQELTLTVRNGQVVLRERNTNQRIIPRLSTAHNFSGANALPVYQFLCDLQTQGLQTDLGFTWRSVAPAAKFWPRLTCGLAVLAVASWQFNAADLQALVESSSADFAQRWAAFRGQWQLPRFFTLAEGDNELFVDADNALLCRVWLDAIRQLSIVLLKEFLFDPPASPVSDVAGRPYVPQCIALLVRQASCYAASAPASAPATAPVPVADAGAVQREFAIGSEWLYYKLYCGQLTADRVLMEAIRPLAAALRKQGLIDNWFFVRYADPDSHLRVRWHLPMPERVGEVICLVAEYLQPLSGDDAIWKIQTDTYRRELERYGGVAVLCAEALFGYQSEALLAYLATPATEKVSSEPWLWGLGAIEDLLTAFGCSLAHKLALLQTLKEAYAQEFGMTKELKRQLDAKYRAARTAVEQALRPHSAPLAAPLVAVAQRIAQLEKQGQLKMPKTALLSSYVHMLLNRLLPADARLHELVLYDFLFRHYQSQQARSRP
ncbi:lantibiotic dehydratase [Hymenobacter coccineus]|uniref:Lantibiotic dehydratase n=1 Tax=Hymenobacter coccineus TaxID=1908235 RepID=A0A1G1TH22_9BACT|nr:lantibiotic dehydratase [Hymenobacter coccineus]OGX90174.1 hypothetical protein BEN49_07425 [Hymenobacter coccineus]